MNKVKIRYFVKQVWSVLAFAMLISAGSAQAQSSVQAAEVEPISQAELEQILAPIALYPDSILAHILVASTYPLEVVQAERWSQRHPELQGQEAVAAAEGEDWDPSVQALVAFPKILQRMSEDLDWTQRLGDAFLYDEAMVLSSVQTLRELAEEAGSLDEMEKVIVTRDKETIIIEPREREIVYVPYYDTRRVYGDWRWHGYQPVYWGYPYADSPYYDDYYYRNHRSAFYWGPRISLSFGFFSSSFHWHDRHVVRIPSRHYRPHRYYNHYDILRHHNAVRWVHNPRRSHGNRYPTRQDRHYDVRGPRNPKQQGSLRNNAVPIHRTRTGHHTRQEEVREQLANRRQPTQNVRVANPKARATANSRLVLPGRARSSENPREQGNRVIRQQQYHQQTQSQRTSAQRQASPARTATAAPRPTQRPVQQQPVQRSAPKPVVSKPVQNTAKKPKTVAKSNRRSQISSPKGPRHGQRSTR